MATNLQNILTTFFFSTLQSNYTIYQKKKIEQKRNYKNKPFINIFD
jgi:uncharacterized membrane protein